MRPGLLALPTSRVSMSRVLMTWVLQMTCMLLVAAAAGAAAPATAWPHVALPPGVQIFDVGQQLQVNGLPMQVRGFLSPEPAARLVDWFRASLGSPLVENRRGAATILGRPQGAYYLTVQIEPAGSGARGLVALTDVPRMMASHGETRAEEARWQARLPAGMRILSLVRAFDDGRMSEHLVLESAEPLAASRHALTRLLQQDGYTPGRVVASAAPPGATLYFQAPGREAMAVLTRSDDRLTSIVLSIATVISIARGLP
jgi:hypothetical protein